LLLGNTMLTVIVQLFHKAFHFCVLEPRMSLVIYEDIQVAACISRQLFANILIPCCFQIGHSSVVWSS
jgi:hypothetical protein